MAWRIVSGSYGEPYLVVELARCRDVTFLLDMESHALGPGLDLSTLRTSRAGDNPLRGI